MIELPLLLIDVMTLNCQSIVISDAERNNINQLFSTSAELSSDTCLICHAVTAAFAAIKAIMMLSEVDRCYETNSMLGICFDYYWLSCHLNGYETVQLNTYFCFAYSNPL